jgi:hypothetical protein
LFQGGYCLFVIYRREIVEELCEGPPRLEVVQQRLNRNTRSDEHRRSPRISGSLWIICCPSPMLGLHRCSQGDTAAARARQRLGNLLRTLRRSGPCGTARAAPRGRQVRQILGNVDAAAAEVQIFHGFALLASAENDGQGRLLAGLALTAIQPAQVQLHLTGVGRLEK